MQKALKVGVRSSCSAVAGSQHLGAISRCCVAPIILALLLCFLCPPITFLQTITSGGAAHVALDDLESLEVWK